MAYYNLIKLAEASFEKVALPKMYRKAKIVYDGQEMRISQFYNMLRRKTQELANIDENLDEATRKIQGEKIINKIKDMSDKLEERVNQINPRMVNEVGNKWSRNKGQAHTLEALREGVNGKTHEQIVDNAGINAFNKIVGDRSAEASHTLYNQERVKKLVDNTPDSPGMNIERIRIKQGNILKRKKQAQEAEELKQKLADIEARRKATEEAAQEAQRKAAQEAAEEAQRKAAQEAQRKATEEAAEEARNAEIARLKKIREEEAKQKEIERQAMRDARTSTPTVAPNPAASPTPDIGSGTGNKPKATKSNLVRNSLIGTGILGASIGAKKLYDHYKKD